jgi:hypothetical protein
MHSSAHAAGNRLDPTPPFEQSPLLDAPRFTEQDRAVLGIDELDAPVSGKHEWRRLVFRRRSWRKVRRSVFPLPTRLVQPRKLLGRSGQPGRQQDGSLGRFDELPGAFGGLRCSGGRRGDNGLGGWYRLRWWGRFGWRLRRAPRIGWPHRLRLRRHGSREGFGRLFRCPVFDQAVDQDDVAGVLTHRLRQPGGVGGGVQVAVCPREERVLDHDLADGRAEGKDPARRIVLSDRSDQPQRVVFARQLQRDQGGETSVRRQRAQRLGRFSGGCDPCHDLEVRMPGQKVVQRTRALELGFDQDEIQCASLVRPSRLLSADLSMIP